jgi:hypothetical protein
MCDMPGGEKAFDAFLLRLALHLLAALVILIRSTGSRDRSATHFIVLYTLYDIPSKTSLQQLFCMPCRVHHLRSHTQGETSEASLSELDGKELSARE